MSLVARALLAAASLTLLAAGCGAEAPAPAAPPAAPAEPTPPPTEPASAAATPSPAPPDPVDAGPPPECPEGMVHVQHDFCPDMRRRCEKSEYDKSNHITICHRFAEGESTCKGERRKLDFCIDEYEFPNEKGGHPPVMVSWYDSMGACAQLGKRLCYESEWVAACEGPDETPFPYGWSRSKEMCNIDNKWIGPSLNAIYRGAPDVKKRELERLDQSVPSGSMETCKSGYGVYDLTGNFDEWALADYDRPGKRADFAALKGGAWGHVRNACRPVTTSHRPEFTYYFVSFRCCKDPASMKPVEPEAD